MKLWQKRKKIVNAPAGIPLNPGPQQTRLMIIEPPRQATSPASLFEILSALPPLHNINRRLSPSAHVRRQSLPVWPPTVNEYQLLQSLVCQWPPKETQALHDNHRQAQGCTNEICVSMTKRYKEGDTSWLTRVQWDLIVTDLTGQLSTTLSTKPDFKTSHYRAHIDPTRTRGRTLTS